MGGGSEPTAVCERAHRTRKEIGDIRVSGAEDPGVEIAPIGVDRAAILAPARHEDSEASRHRMVRDLLWAEFGITDRGEMITAHEVVWRGTQRRGEVRFPNRPAPERPSTHEINPPDPPSLPVVLPPPLHQRNRTPPDDTT